MALSSSYDNQAINGNGVSPNVNGIINQLTDPSNPTTVAAFDDWVEAFADAIDGLWAMSEADIRMIVNVDAMKLAAKTFRGTAANGGPAIVASAYLKTATADSRPIRACPRPPRQSPAHRPPYGQDGHADRVPPDLGTLAIDDIYSDSAKGERHFTVHTLVGDKVILVQPAAYSLVEFKVA